jgi:hypothetical protein
MSTNEPKVQGEGDYESARRYDESAKRFVEEGKVGPAAERARTDDPAERADLERAEQAGRERAREEDRLLREGGSQASSGERPDGGGGEGGRPGA